MGEAVNSEWRMHIAAFSVNKKQKTADRLSLRLSKNYRFPSSLSLETTLSTETEEKPRLAGTFFLPLYKKSGTRPDFL